MEWREGGLFRDERHWLQIVYALNQQNGPNESSYILKWSAHGECVNVQLAVPAGF